MPRLARLAAMAACFVFPTLLPAQVPDVLPDETEFQRASGRNIQPFYEGWQKMPDGHIVMWFGYLNRNFKQIADVPIGPNNHFDLKPDMGQPAHFYPRRHLFVFKVDVPDGWPADKRLVWTVNFNGRPATANGWLQPEWEIDDGVIQMNLGPGGAPPENPRNAAPRITVRGDTTVAPTAGVPSPQWEHLTHSDNIPGIPGGGTANGSAPHADSRHMEFDANGDVAGFIGKFVVDGDKYKQVGILQ